MTRKHLVEDLKTIIETLRELHQRPLATRADLAEFENRTVQLIVATSDAARGCMPAKLHHWLSDADVRLKDEVMRSQQEAWFVDGMSELVAKYESIVRDERCAEVPGSEVRRSAHPGRRRQ